MIDLSGPPETVPRVEVGAMNEESAKRLVAEARKIARQADSWIRFSNALSDPRRGLIPQYFPDPEQRRAFLRSPEYEELNQLLLRIIKRKGLYGRAVPGSKGTTG